MPGKNHWSWYINPKVLSPGQKGGFDE